MTDAKTVVAAVCVVLALCARASALDPALDVSQYAHTAWKISEGFSEGTIQSIAQTTDGYLWLGTEFGLLRFDGVRAVPWKPQAGQFLRNSDIRSLKGSRDGRLWIGTSSGLASWKDGTLTVYPELDGQIIEALLEDREGTIWVAGWALSRGRLCRIQRGVTQCSVDDGRFGSGATALHEDPGGHIWLGAMNRLWRWTPGARTPDPTPAPADRIYALADSDDGGILIATHSGITKLRNGKSESYPLPQGFQPHRLLSDHDGALWIGALVDRGLLHIHDGKTDRFTYTEGLSGRSVTALFEDRERNMWVATADGLDRFRDFAIPTFGDQQGLSSRGIFSVLSANDGSLWLGATDGLNRWTKDGITLYRTGDRGLPEKAESLFQDRTGQLWVGTRAGVVFFQSDRFVPVASIPRYGIVFAFADDGAGNVWVSHQEALFHVSGARVLERIPWVALGRTQPASALHHDPAGGGLWLGFRDGGIAHLREGQLRASYAVAEGLGAGEVRDFYVDTNGTLWASTAEGGLSRIKDGHILTLTSDNGLPCNTVHWMMEDDAQAVWLYLACGLVRVGRPELDAWASHPKQTIRATVFDSSDGVSKHRSTGGYYGVVAKSADGKLWFVRHGGVSVIDPSHLRLNELPPPAHIEQVTADGKTYDATNGLRLPPHVRNLAIDYTALSLVAPEKVHFRYKLDGQNRDWHDVANDRQVQYTNLAPGPYRFRVVASNNSGVWNETGATLDFSIAPAYYQTMSFRVAAIVAFLALLAAAYQLRMWQVARQFNRTLDARVSERTRIARDLHDTLLQSLQGLLLRFHSALNLLPARPDDARERLERALDQAEAAITEGRNAVQGLRASATTLNDLANGIAAVGAELTGDPSAGDVPKIDVEIDGASRDLNPVVRDEAYRIAGEALRNAFKHAQARQIIVTVHYEARQLRVTIRDDGKGMDEETMRRQQPSGHFGLPGMRERAAIAGGRLEVRSALGSGTEIELRIPSAIAYRASRRRSWSSRLLRTPWLLGSLLVSASLVVPMPIFAAPATSIRAVRVPIVTGAPLQFGANISDLTIDAGLAGHAEGKAHATPGRLQKSHAQGGDAPVRELKFTHLTSNDGLAQDSIVATLQDRRGFMWLATGGGLNRYDGNTFVVYQNNPDDPNTLSANSTQSLVEDDRGDFWIGTWGGGLDKFDPTTERFTHYRYNPDDPNSISGDRVKTLARDSRGNLWVGTIDAGLNKFDPATGTFTRYRNDSNGQFVGAVNSIVEDSHREIWFAGARGLFHVSPQTGQIVRPPVTMDSLAADYLHVDKSGNFWMLANSPTVSLVKYDHRTERLSEYPIGEGAVGIVHSTILDDGQNGLWVASSLGLYHFDLQTEQFTYRFRHDDTNPNSLSDDKVVSIYRDRTGLLWIGTETGGLNILDFQQEQFALYRHRPGAPDGLSPGVVTAMYQDRKAMLWVGFLPRALDKFDRRTGHATHYLPSSGNGNTLGQGSNLNGIHGDAQGYLWFGGWGALDRFDERTGEFKHYQHKPDDPRSLLSHEILCIYEDRSGRLWVGQVGGLSRFDPETEKFINYPNSPTDASGPGDTGVSAIYQDRSGTIWFGTWMGTLSRFDEKANTFVNYNGDSRKPHRISSGGIWDIHEDRAGALWLGTWDGLYRYNREHETFTQYTVNQGLPSAVIQCILDDRRGRLWLSTRKGISRFDPHNETFRNYDVFDGLQSNDFAINSCYEDGQSGEMLFGGSNGITAFFPEHIRDNPYVPPVVLTSFKIFNKSAPVGATSVLKKAIPYVESLTLSYRDSVFSFEFAALSYASSHKNRYRYKLDNFEPGWNEVGSKQRLATYTNLDPGKYVFRVQGSNSDGVWNEEGVSLAILITPPWWRTNSFRALFAIVLVTVMWAAYQLRLRQLAAQFNLRLEERVSERTRIARDLHDTLLQSFQGVLLRFQSVSKVLPAGADEAQARLDRALDQAEAAITEGRNAVQGLRSSATTLNDLANGIVAVGAELTSDPSASDPPAIEVDVVGESRDLNPVVRDEAYRIAGEALRNAVRHAQAHQIIVTIHYEARQLRVTIRDDGKGIDEETIRRQQVAGHFGLPGMRERAAIVRGRLDVVSQVGAGTEIELRVPGPTAYGDSGRTSWWSRLRRRTAEPSGASGHD